MKLKYLSLLMMLMFFAVSVINAQTWTKALTENKQELSVKQFEATLTINPADTAYSSNFSFLNSKGVFDTYKNITAGDSAQVTVKLQAKKFGSWGDLHTIYNASTKLGLEIATDTVNAFTALDSLRLSIVTGAATDSSTVIKLGIGFKKYP